MNWQKAPEGWIGSFLSGIDGLRTEQKRGGGSPEDLFASAFPLS